MVHRVHKDTFTSRSRIVTVFLMLFSLIIVGRLFMLQVVGGAEAKIRAGDQHGIYKRLLPARGEIKISDRNSSEGYAVATNIKKYLVYAVPGEVVNPAETAEKLSAVLSMESADVLSKITRTDKKYVPIKKKISDQEEQQVRDLKLYGIYFDSEDTRVYPEKTLLAQTLGFVGYRTDAKEGLYGLEKSFETALSGTPGSVNEEKDASGSWIFGSRRDITPAVDGTNLVLTIDKSIQFKVESVLKETVTKHEADGGSIIVADPKTGAILAMATYPDFDPNEYNKVEDAQAFVNKATMGNYEPGSIFKPITMAAALDLGKITPDTTYEDKGFVEIDNYTIKNSDAKAHGVQTMTQVLEESLNTGTIFAKEQIGNEEFYKYIQKFGFGQPTGVEVPETKGNLDNLKADIKVNYHTASFGQGISVTPIQLIKAFTAIANQGKMMKPYLVQSKISPDGRVENTEAQEVTRVISEKTAATLSAMLVNVVENGHGKRAGVPGYYIAGKTGTAQVPKKDGKGYEENNNIGSFIGFGPVESPQFVMLVRIDHPRTVSFAETTAAPAFGEIAQFILNYLNIPPTRK